MKIMDGVIAIILNRSSEILLIKRRDVPVWVLPGGGIERGEDPEDAIIREVKEETGFKVTIKRKVAEYTNNQNGKKDTLFECSIIKGKASTGLETKAIDFFDLESLPTASHPLLQEWLNDFKKGSKFVLKKEAKVVSKTYALSQFFQHPIIVLRFFLVKLGIRINT